MGRPVLVWIIFLITLFAVILQMGSIYFLYSNSHHLPQEVMARLNEVTSEEIAVDLLVNLYCLVSVIALFMMRRIALPLCLISIPIGILQYGWTVYLHGWEMVTDAGSLFVMLFSFGIGLLICLYVWSLDQRGALA